MLRAIVVAVAMWGAFAVIISSWRRAERQPPDFMLRAAAYVGSGGVLNKAVLGYEFDHGSLPERLEDLLGDGDLNLGSTAAASYLASKDDLIDPWGRPYVYSRKPILGGGVRFDLRSVGPDGVFGTSDDVSNRYGEGGR